MAVVAQNTEQGLLSAIVADPWDDLPRLVYADWLDENGDPMRAELIRVACAMMSKVDARSSFPLDDWLRAVGLWHELLRNGGIRELGPALSQYFSDQNKRNFIGFHRGFIDYIKIVDNPSIREIPEWLVVTGSLCLPGTSIASVPDTLHIGRDLDLSRTPVKTLPPGFRVGNDLILIGSALETLPEGLWVGRNLDISSTQVKRMPRALHVGGNIIADEGIDLPTKPKHSR